MIDNYTEEETSTQLPELFDEGGSYTLGRLCSFIVRQAGDKVAFTKTVQFIRDNNLAGAETMIWLMEKGARSDYDVVAKIAFPDIANESDD
jgi:hypothetical protein